MRGKRAKELKRLARLACAEAKQPHRSVEVYDEMKMDYKNYPNAMLKILKEKKNERKHN